MNRQVVTVIDVALTQLPSMMPWYGGICRRYGVTACTSFHAGSGSGGRVDPTWTASGTIGIGWTRLKCSGPSVSVRSAAQALHGMIRKRFEIPGRSAP